MFRKKKKKRVGDAGKGLERLLPVAMFGLQQRFFLSRQGFLVPCHDSGFYVSTGFSLSRVFLGRGCGCSLYGDNVATEVPLS